MQWMLVLHTNKTPIRPLGVLGKVPRSVGSNMETGCRDTDDGYKSRSRLVRDAYGGMG